MGSLGLYFHEAAICSPVVIVSGPAIMRSNKHAVGVRHPHGRRPYACDPIGLHPIPSHHLGIKRDLIPLEHVL
jgi:hypothetical protein